jgi:hypothetical protein
MGVGHGRKTRREPRCADWVAFEDLKGLTVFIAWCKTAQQTGGWRTAANLVTGG